MFGITDKISAALGLVAGAAGIFLVMIAWQHLVTIPAAEERGKEQVRAEARQRALDLMQKRKEDDTEISTFDLEQFCREFGGKWLHNDCVD